MKILIELEVGIETAVVVSALESQENLFRDPMCTNRTTNMYADVSERLKNKINELCENVGRSSAGKVGE